MLRARRDLVALLLLTGVLPDAALRADEPATPTGWPARALHRQVNALRQARGLPPLQDEPRPRAVAQGHCRDMARRGDFAQRDPEGRGPGERLADGFSEWVGSHAENLYHVPSCASRTCIACAWGRVAPSTTWGPSSSLASSSGAVGAPAGRGVRACRAPGRRGSPGGPTTP